MGKFYTVHLWLEDREIKVLKDHNFLEEVPETSINKKERFILTDLEMKGFLRSFTTGRVKYYQGCTPYLQAIKGSN